MPALWNEQTRFDATVHVVTKRERRFFRDLHIGPTGIHLLLEGVEAIVELRVGVEDRHQRKQHSGAGAATYAQIVRVGCVGAVRKLGRQ